MMFHPKHVFSSLKIELQQNRMVHQSDILLRAAPKPITDRLRALKNKTKSQIINNLLTSLGPDYMRPARTLTGTTQIGTIKFT